MGTEYMITPKNKINVPLKGAEDWSCIFIIEKKKSVGNEDHVINMEDKDLK